MILTVSLVEDIHPERVTEVIEARMAWIMSRADGIDIGLFHEDNVLKHTLV